MTDQGGNGYVTSDYFLRPFERRYADVDLPGGNKARIRNLTEAEKTSYEQSQYDIENQQMRPDSRIVLICLCLVGEDDRPLFPGVLSMNTVDSFRLCDGAVTDILEDACREHCGLTPAGKRKLTADFRQTPVGSSYSD